MKIFHTSDWHLDQLTHWTTKKSMKIENISEMTEYSLLKIEEMIDFAIKQKVNFFVFGGDLFEDAISNFKEKEIVTNILLQYINKLKENGIRCIFLSGNHDIIFKKIASNKNSLSLLSDVDYGEYLFVNKPESKEIEIKDYLINGKEIRMILFPYIKGELTKEEIKNQIKKLTSEKSSILVGHLDVFGALYNGLEIQFTNLDNPNVWTPDELEDLGAELVLLGHVHNHQILGKNKTVIYCGSPFRLSFNEEKSEKGFYIHSKKEDGLYENKFFNLNDRIWKTIEYDYLLENKIFQNLIEKIKVMELSNGIVRIKIKNILKEELKYYPAKEIQDLFRSKNIFLDRGVMKEYLSNSQLNVDGNQNDFSNLESSLEPKSILKNILSKNGENKKSIELTEKELIEILAELK